MSRAGRQFLLLSNDWSFAESYGRPDSECGKCERRETETAGRFPAEWIEEVKRGGI